MMFFMIAALLGINYYIFYRIWNMLPPNTIIRILLVIVAVILIVSPFISILVGASLPATITSVLYKIGTSWFFISIYVLILFLLLDLLRVTHLFPMEKILYGNPVAFGVIVLLMAGIFTFGYFNYLNKRRVELSLATEKQMTTPLKIVAVSDLHLGYGIGKDELIKWVTLINDENPDIVLVAGDLIDNNVKPLYDRNMIPELKKIKSKYGMYVIPGNHEYIGDISKASKFLIEAGFTLLRDSACLVNDEVYILGRDDRSNPKRKSLAELTEGLDNTKPIILLDHQPYNLEEAEAAGIDLQLSGHTHRGQIWPISWVTDAMYEKSHGYLKKGNSHIYVSSGLGLWGGKFRIGTQSEYVVIELH